jgi:hypothetical protein
MIPMPGAASARRAPTQRAQPRFGCRGHATLLGARWPWAIAAFAMALGSSGCQQSNVVIPPPPTGSAALQVLANAVPGTVNRLVVEVTAVDIPTPLRFDIVVSGGSASGTITVPVGPARTLTIRAYDGGGIESHRGTTTLNVQPSANPTVSISLASLQGQQRIDVRVESLVITVTPAAVTLRVTQTARLQTVVTTATGDPVSVAATDIRWATLQPNVATVGTAGEVLGVSPGSARIVAVYAGVGGAAAITVTPAPVLQAAGDVAKCTPSDPAWAAALLDDAGNDGHAGLSSRAPRIERRVRSTYTKPTRRKPQCSAA